MIFVGASKVEKKRRHPVTFALNITDGETFFKNLLSSPPQPDLERARRILKELEEKVEEETGMSVEEYLEKAIKEEKDPRERVLARMALQAYRLAKKRDSQYKEA